MDKTLGLHSLMQYSVYAVVDPEGVAQTPLPVPHF